MKMTVGSSTSSSRTPPSSTSTARNNNQYYDRTPGGGGGGDSSSCYYPGCRKDANCHCNICIHSFNATRDLILNQSSSSLIISPPNKRNKKTNKKIVYYSSSNKKRVEGFSWGLISCKLVFFLAVLILIWAMDSGFLMKLVSKKNKLLTPDTVRGFVEEGRVAEGDFKLKLGILQRKVEEVVGIGKVSNCTSKDSLWKLNQEGHHFFFLWRCVIYQSMTEELSVWGSPLQTSGLVVAGVSSRSIILLSGTVTEWSEDRRLVPMTSSSTRRSWTLGKWSSAAVQLERETWLLEYHQRNALFQGPGLIQDTREIFMLRLQNMARKYLKLCFYYNNSSKERRSRLKNPT